jgi:uncharacterized membrane protein YkvA (DUF1232 family)
MPEVIQFVHKGAAQITQKNLEDMLHKIPMLKAEFTQINAPKFPHLVDQLEFLADVVEDYVEGIAKDIPLFTIACAAFAILYTHRSFEIMPGNISEFGKADDSSIVRAVLIEHEGSLRKYANQHEHDWSSVTINA